MSTPLIDPEPPVFKDPAADVHVPTGDNEFALRRIRPLWQQDVYGTPAWMYCLLMTAIGVIAGILVSVAF